MQLEEMKAKKKELEDETREKIQQFINEAGVKVDDIYITVLDVTPMGGATTYVVDRVELVVRL